MATKLQRMTFVVTPEIETGLKKCKKEIYYAQSQSDMIRDLVSAGLRALEQQKVGKNGKTEKSA